MVTYTQINLSPDELKGIISQSLKEHLSTIPTATRQTPKELLTVKELATILKKTTKTIYLWKDENKIPYIQTDKAILFDYDEVMKTLKNWKGLNYGKGDL